MTKLSPMAKMKPSSTARAFNIPSPNVNREAVAPLVSEYDFRWVLPPSTWRKKTLFCSIRAQVTFSATGMTCALPLSRTDSAALASSTVSKRSPVSMIESCAGYTGASSLRNTGT